jgi:ankyrin repeat protein
MAAAMNGDPTAVQAVLSIRQDLEAVDSNGWTALIFAAVFKQFEAAELLVKAGSRKGRDDLMISAARQGHVPTVKALLARGIPVGVKDVEGVTPLLAASFDDRAEMVDLLLARGANANAADNQGRTPLMGAAAAGDARLVTTLLHKGADVEAVDKAGRTAWNHAVRSGHPEVAGELEPGRTNK